MERSNDCQQNILNNVFIKKSNSCYNSFKIKGNQNYKINYINKIRLNKNK